MPRKLMVVAHPDDEIIFGGAHLLAGDEWTVICVTNGNNLERRQEFEEVMRRVGADYEIWNYRDTYSRQFDIVRLKRDLQRLVRQNRFAMTVTHGLCGEYGHPQHKVIARMMRQIVPHNLYAFAMGKKKLPEPVLQKKLELLVLYESQEKTILELCRNDSLCNFIYSERFVLVKK